MFGGLAAAATTLFVVDDDVTPPEQYLALALLVALSCWYVATGAKAMHRENIRLGLVYLAVATPLTLLLFYLAPVGSLLMFILYPHFWALLPPRRAMAATAVAVAGTTAVMLVRFAPDPRNQISAVLWMAVILVVSLTLGLWITRIIAQSQQRAELVTELAATRSELATVSHEAGVLAERERLSREIHDTLAQGFTSLLLLIDAIEAELGHDDEAVRRHLRQARGTARDNLAETRSLVAALSPPPLHHASLADAVRQVVDRIAPQLAAEVTTTMTGAVRPLPADQNVVLLRVTQEALSNVRKHAGASQVTVVLTYVDTGVAVEITDDGQGFDPAQPTTGFGLAGMRDRVTQVGGTVTVRSAPGTGTAVRVELAS